MWFNSKEFTNKMYKVELDPTLCRLTELFRLVGIWQNEKESVARESCRRILYFLQIISLFIYFLMGTYQAHLNGDKSQLIFLFEIEITMGIILVKLAYLLWRKDEILKFFYDPILAHCTADRDELVEVNKKNKKIAMFNKLYVRVLFVNLFYVCFTSLRTITHEVKILPLFIRFNLGSDYDVVLYLMAFVYISVAGLLAVIFIFVMLFVWYIMFNYSAEYKLLGHRVRALGKKTSSTYQQEFLNLIRAYNNLFDTIQKFRSCFSTLFLAEIFTGAIYICVSTYNLSYNTPDNVFEVALYVTLLLHSVFEIFLLMYIANEITLESDRLSYCLFESNWMDQSESTKKCLIIMCEMIKIPHQLAVLTYPMNLETFTSIVNGAYRMFNLLKSFK